jgi:hypothetical protein
VTCDSGREYKAYDEMMRLLEDVSMQASSSAAAAASRGHVDPALFHVGVPKFV